MAQGGEGENALKRVEEMAALRRAGATLSAIGERYGLTRERVRQLLAGKGIDDRKVREARRAVAVTEARGSSGEIVQLWREGLSTGEVAKRLNLLASVCEEIIGSKATELDAAERRMALNRRSAASTKQFSDEELINAIRRVARHLGRTPTSSEYEQHAREYDLPSAILVVNRLGWSNAVEAAGLKPHRARRTYTRRWDEDSCVTAVCSVASELGHVPSLKEYETLSAGKPDLPSVATVRNRVGGWAEVRKRVAGLLQR